MAPGRSGAADRGRTCQAIGRRSADAPGRGPRPAGPSGLSPRARGLWVRPPARWDSSCGSGPRGSTSRAGGKHPPDAGLRGSVSSAVLILQAPGCGTRPAGPVGLSLRALGPLACPSGLSFMARTAVSTSRPRGTQPTGSVPRRSTILPGGTERPSSGRGGRPPVPSGFGLRARCSTSQHGLTEPPRAVLHYTARPDGASWRGPRGSTIWPCGTWPLGAGPRGVNQLAGRDLASVRRAAGVNQLAGRDSASGRGGHGSRLGGPAGLSLRARGLGVRPASPEVVLAYCISIFTCLTILKKFPFDYYFNPFLGCSEVCCLISTY